MELRHSVARAIPAFLLLLLLAACGGSKAAAPAGAATAAMQAMPVQVITATRHAIADTSTYVASIQSLSSAMISPQVSGVLQSINVHSGEHVQEGQLLMQINDSIQLAAVANLQHARIGQAATVQFDQQQLERARKLYQEKIGTLMDFQQAQTADNTARSQLDALDAQIRQAQVTLGYYRITAPHAGVVGDIPVRVGDTVAPGTPLTTVDSGQGMQLYVQVPVEQAGQLKTGLPIAVLNAQGAVLARSAIFFVSPQVDPATQTILAKAELNGPDAARLRTQQYVQARITWGSHPGFEVPVLATVQESGSSFLDIAQPRGKGHAVHQQQVTTGTIRGNDVEITGGLTAGQLVIVSTHQILREGMPVMPLPAGAAPGKGGAPAAAGKGR